MFSADEKIIPYKEKSSLKQCVLNNLRKYVSEPMFIAYKRGHMFAVMVHVLRSLVGFDLLSIMVGGLAFLTSHLFFFLLLLLLLTSNMTMQPDLITVAELSLCGLGLTWISGCGICGSILLLWVPATEEGI